MIPNVPGAKGTGRPDRGGQRTLAKGTRLSKQPVLSVELKFSKRESGTESRT